MRELSAWLYPWDLLDKPVEMARTVEKAALSRLDIAVSYHSLLAVLPGRRTRPFVELGASALYTEPSEATWDGAVIRPRRPLGAESLGDALMLGRNLTESAGCALGAWTVLLHDSRMTERAPQVATQSMWDRPLAALICPRHPHIRDYAARLVVDIGRRADLVQLESAHWGTLPHHRHVKLAGPGAEIRSRLLELCFCSYCTDDATSHGLDIEHLRHELQQVWDDAHSSNLSWSDAMTQVPELETFMERRTSAVTELVAHLVDVCPVPVEALAFGDRERVGFDLKSVRAVGARTRVLAYGDEGRVCQAVEEVGKEVLQAGTGLGVSLMADHIDSSASFTSVLAAAAAASPSVGVYNLGLVETPRLDWFISAVERLRWSVAEAGQGAKGASDNG